MVSPMPAAGGVLGCLLLAYPIRECFLEVIPCCGAYRTKANTYTRQRGGREFSEHTLGKLRFTYGLFQEPVAGSCCRISVVDRSNVTDTVRVHESMGGATLACVLLGSLCSEIPADSSKTVCWSLAPTAQQI